MANVLTKRSSVNRPSLERHSLLGLVGSDDQDPALSVVIWDRGELISNLKHDRPTLLLIGGHSGRSCAAEHPEQYYMLSPRLVVRPNRKRSTDKSLGIS